MGVFDLPAAPGRRVELLPGASFGAVLTGGMGNLGGGGVLPFGDDEE